MNFSLAGKVAVVTGAGNGIGKAVAEMFVEQGAKVALVGRSQSVTDLQSALGKSAKAYVRDVSDFEAIDETIDQIHGYFGGLDILVNNAGISICEPAESVTDAAWDRTMEVNVKAALKFSQSVGRIFLKQSYGKIINMASQAAVVALADHLSYCVSKAAMIALTRGLALEWGPHGVQVNAISPTIVLTEMGHRAWAGDAGEAMKSRIPLRRFAQPREIAAAAVFLAGEGSDMITGANLVVDGGFTIH